MKIHFDEALNPSILYRFAAANKTIAPYKTRSKYAVKSSNISAYQHRNKHKKVTPSAYRLTG